MAKGYTLDAASVQAIAEDHRRLAGTSLTRKLGRSKYPILGGGEELLHFRLTGANYIHRGSHPDGVDAVEVRLASIDSAGRAVWEQVGDTVKLYCASNGVYVQRDSGRVGNNPTEPGGGDPAEPPPCPPFCNFTGHGQLSAEVTNPPAWWRTGTAAAEILPTALEGIAPSTVYAVTGKRIAASNGETYNVTVGQWESEFIGVVGSDDIDGGEFGSVTIDGIGTVQAGVFCTDGVSGTSTVKVHYREMAGAGGFVITQMICCVGYEL